MKKLQYRCSRRRYRGSIHWLWVRYSRHRWEILSLCTVYMKNLWSLNCSSPLLRKFALLDYGIVFSSNSYTFQALFEVILDLQLHLHFNRGPWTISPFPQHHSYPSRSWRWRWAFPLEELKPQYPLSLYKYLEDLHITKMISNISLLVFIQLSIKEFLLEPSILY